MPIQLESAHGKINVSDEVIATLAGSAALECYGLVGMASRQQLKDGIAEFLGKENVKRGVEIQRENDMVQINLHIYVSYGTKISEVAHNVQTRVKYVLNEIIGLDVDVINVFVQGVRVTK